MGSLSVHYVEDHRLPAEQTWVLARDSIGTMIFVKRSRANPAVIREAVRAARELDALRSLPAIA